VSGDLIWHRLERNGLLMLALLVVGAWIVRPDEPRVAVGVLGGGALAALSYRAIRSGVEGASGGAAAAAARRRALVKFFTRHAILALAAYGMMVRLHLDPVGMLLGVSVPVAAVTAEALRSLRDS
jgi:hypothetical protein